MSDTVPTVRVVRNGVVYRINATDYNPANDTLADDQADPPAPASAPPAPSAPVVAPTPPAPASAPPAPLADLPTPDAAPIPEGSKVGEETVQANGDMLQTIIAADGTETLRRVRADQYATEKAAASAPPPAPVVTDGKFVAEIKGKFYIVNGMGTKLSKHPYATQAEAVAGMANV